jgi:hypothetical protein
VIDELAELDGADMFGPPARLPDMFGQVFEDGLVLDLLEEPLEELLEVPLDEGELELVDVLTAALAGRAVVSAAGLDVDEFVVTTCPLDSGVESAEAAAAAPPTKAPDTPSMAIACLSFGRMLNIISFL